MTHIRHIIIAGSNKCGTTSLYRYLSDHPAVCGSVIKEVGFFHKLIDCDGSDAFYRYMKLFPHRKDNHSFCVEATPTYLDSGRIIANRINSILDRPYILLLLREPAERLVSYYRSQQGLETSLISGLSFTQFVEKAMHIVSNPQKAVTETDKRIGYQVKKAYYAGFITEYLQVMPPDQFRLLFFERLRDSPISTMRSLCTSIGLSPDFYTDYTFHIENRSRFHRSSRLRTLGTRVNSALEPVLNQVPPFRRGIRFLYNAVNTIQGKELSIDSATLHELRAHFRPHNKSLRSLLERKLLIDEFPDWLSIE